MRNIKLLLVLLAFMASSVTFGQTRIIAHRGYWTPAGSAQNSLAALIGSHNIGVYGSEFDVWITADDQLVVNHNPEIGGVTIETARYGQIKNMRLKNGERLCTLKSYLQTGKKQPDTKLILEIKPHASEANENRCVDAVVKMVAEEGVKDLVEYISFSLNVCKRLVAKAPGAKVSYLKGDLTPRQVKDLGMTGIDYAGSLFAIHPTWMKEAHDLGLTVNVWTIDDLDDLNDFIKAGADFITTNKPVEGKKLAE
ncbi:MAG: glycerophosphodiester phosphodiesterase family protein [Prevotella sp.]